MVDWDGARVDRIGQNGNTGEHYEVCYKTGKTHVWVSYPSTKTRQCIDCKYEQGAPDSAGLTTHKRKSSVEKV